MAHVTDLQIVEVEGQPWFEFEWAGQDWHSALTEIKQIPPEARSYDENTKRWRVADTFENVLEGIFPNFASTLDAIRSQASLF